MSVPDEIPAALVAAGIGMPPMWVCVGQSLISVYTGQQIPPANAAVRLNYQTSQGLIRQLAMWSGDDGEGDTYYIEPAPFIRRGVVAQGIDVYRLDEGRPSNVREFRGASLGEVVSYIGLDHLIRRKLGWEVEPRTLMDVADLEEVSGLEDTSTAKTPFLALQLAWRTLEKPRLSPESVRLRHRQQWESLAARCQAPIYMVGSYVTNPETANDIDIVAAFGDNDRPRWFDRLKAQNKLSASLSQETGLPIDFKIQNGIQFAGQAAEQPTLLLAEPGVPIVDLDEVSSFEQLADIMSDSEPVGLLAGGPGFFVEEAVLMPDEEFIDALGWKEVEGEISVVKIDWGLWRVNIGKVLPRRFFYSSELEPDQCHRFDEDGHVSIDCDPDASLEEAIRAIQFEVQS